jgi:hypothetical protein
MDDSSNLDQKVSAHTDKVVIGFRVKADEDECNSEDVNDVEDIDKAIDTDVVNNPFFDRGINADTVTNDNDFSDTSHAVFFSSSTSEKKRRVIAIIGGWTCDKCTYQHKYPTQICVMCNVNRNDEDKDGNATGGYSSSSSSARSVMTTASKREWSLANEKD